MAVIAVRKTPRALAVFSLIFLFLCVSFAFAENPYWTAAEQNLRDHGLTVEDVINDYQGELSKVKGPASFFLPWLPDGAPSFTLFDVTGDGCVDLVSGRMFGSGMVRLELVVFDPLAHEKYVLDGYNYDYSISSVSEDRLVVAKRGPNGYGDPVTETLGTMVLEDGLLVFVPDETASE